MHWYTLEIFPLIHDKLDDASERDKRRLSEELHIATVIDLRSRCVFSLDTECRFMILMATTQNGTPNGHSEASR